MMLAATALAALALLSTCLVLGLGHVYRDRWGLRTVGAAPTGAGAYRAGVAPVQRPRGLPVRVGLAAGTGFVWSALTALVFAPAGTLLAVVLFEEAPWFSGLLLLTCLSGFALAVSLAVVGFLIVRRSDAARRYARVVALYSLGHHAVVALVMSLASLADREAAVLLLAAIPCLMGAAHAALLYGACGAASEGTETD